MQLLCSLAPPSLEGDTLGLKPIAHLTVNRKNMGISYGFEWVNDNRLCHIFIIKAKYAFLQGII